jgi:2-polyprenyl-6-methoxyphenol hydroxylase-like FAD-dependent oxidoreductase
MDAGDGGVGMPVVGARVAIVGGSIAGCAAALALSRVGCEVTVYERSRGELKDRGAGIGIPGPLRQELVSAGYLDAAMPVCPTRERVWMVRDGEARDGREIWRQPCPVAMNNWGVLWRTLRAGVPDELYRQGAVIDGVEADGDGASIAFADGSQERFDLVVGADGYRSMVRSLVHPGSRPVYAGYLAWRGNSEEGRLPDLGPMEVGGSFVTVCFPGGHGLFFLIPGFDYRGDRGHRRMNWVIYSAAPEGTCFDDPASMPPGSVSDDLGAFLDDLLDEYFPPYWAQVVRLTDAQFSSVQPIYDHTIPTYVSDRAVLIGDAATLTRPHTASGTTKALQDALTLERACQEHDCLDEALTAYDHERCAAGNELVELGRRLGRAQVEETPDWASMAAEDFEAWTWATLAGKSLYLYDSVADVDRAKIPA